MNTILNQPYRRRVSTDQLNREDRQLAASLEGEPGRTPAGKTLLHSKPDVLEGEDTRKFESHLTCTMGGRNKETPTFGAGWISSMLLATKLFVTTKNAFKTSEHPTKYQLAGTI